MTGNLERAIKQWLRGELGSAGDRAAERALRRVFRSLPLPTPRPELLERTLAQLGLAQPAGLPVTRRAHWALRAVAVAALATSGLAVAAFGPRVLGSLSWRQSLDWLTDAGAGVLAGTTQRLADGYVIVEVLGRAGATAADAMATPQMFGWMLVVLLLGSVTIRLLAGSAAAERSPYHV